MASTEPFTEGKLPRTAEALAYLEFLFPDPAYRQDVPGRIWLATLDEGKHWKENCFAAGVDQFRGSTHGQMLGDLAEAAVKASDDGLDVYVCPYPQRAIGRRSGEALQRNVLHADIDGAHDEDRAHALGAAVVRSGSIAEDGSPKVHCYLPLSESVDPQAHKKLCSAFGQALGGEFWDSSKVNDNDVLRVPGTINWKDRTHPQLVRWEVKP